MSVPYWNQKYLKNIRSFRHPFHHHCISLNSCLPSRIAYKSVSQPYFCLSRCICIFDFVCCPHRSKGCMLMASSYKRTWWPGPLHTCHFSLVCIAQLSGSVLGVIAGTVPGRLSEIQVTSLLKQTLSSQTDVLQRTSASSWHFHHICGLRHTYLLKAIGFTDLHRSLESSLFYSGRKWHLQKWRGTFTG